MPIHLRRVFFATLFVLFSSTACGSDLVQKVTQLLNAAEQAALDAIVDEATAAGGAAMLVTAETEVDLRILDSGSSIEGARVQFPAGALPIDVKAAALSIRPAGAVVVPPGDQSAGPGVEIRLQNLTGLEDVQLVTAATVTVPYELPAHEVTANTDTRLQLAHQSGETWEYLAGRTALQDDLLLSGETVSFSPFTAVLTPEASPATDGTTTPTTPAGDEPDNMLTYAVHDTDSVLCQGSFDLSEETFWPNLQYRYSATGSSNYDLEVSLPANSDGRFNVFSDQEEVLPLPTGAGQDLVANALFHDLNVFCDGLRVFNWDGNNITTADIQVSEWSTETTNANFCGTFLTPCTIHYGSARLTVELDFQDSNTPWMRGTASVDVVIPEASWEVMD